MRRFVLVLAVCLLAVTFAVGQSAQPSPSSGQQPEARPSQQQQPPSQKASESPSSPSGAQPTPKSGDTTVSGSSSTQSNSETQPPNPEQSAQRASTQGGLPWGWILIGLAAVAILIALATRRRTGGVDRVERVESIDKTERHDDIRRAG